MKKGKTTHTINRNGYHLLIDDVPAWICTQCDEVYFDNKAVDAIQEAIKNIDASIHKVKRIEIA